MHPAAVLQFERMIGEYTRGVPFRKRNARRRRRGGGDRRWNCAPRPQPLPAEWCAELGLPDRATYAAAADIFLEAFAGQTSVPWPYDFPRKTAIPDPTVRELHPQPSDDSAFQP